MPFPQFPRISPAAEQMAVQLYQRGWSPNEVAKRVGHSRRAVRSALDRAGIRPRNGARAQAVKAARERDRIQAAERRAAGLVKRNQHPMPKLESLNLPRCSFVFDLATAAQRK